MDIFFFYGDLILYFVNCQYYENKPHILHVLITIIFKYCDIMFAPYIRNISTWNFYFLTYDDGKYRIDGIFIAIYCLNGFLHPMGRLWDIMSTDKTLTNKMSTDKMSNRQNVDKKGKKFISRLDISMNKIFFFQKWSNHF